MLYLVIIFNIRNKLIMKNLLIVFILFPILAFSQTKTISGTVNDENNLTLVGVNITVENSNIGALTDFDGNY